MRVKKNLSRKTRRGAARRHAALSVALLLLVATFLVPSSMGDDTDLLRQNTAEPYLFILLDTSLSMSLAIDGTTVHGDADDPRSRLYLAKEALYDVISTVPGVRYGFATFNQDRLNAVTKHFLYSVKDDASRGTPGPNGTAARKIGQALGLKDSSGRDDSYPRVETGAIGAQRGVFVTRIIDGFPTSVVEIDGDLLTLGRGVGEIEAATPPTKLSTNSCDDPLDMSDATIREAVNRFPKFGMNGNLPTELWVTNGTTIKDKGNVYPVPFLLVFTPAGGSLGDDEITVNVKVYAATDSVGDGNEDPCNGAVADTSTLVADEDVKLVFQKSFLMTEDGNTSTKFKVGEESDGTDIYSDAEASGGYWNMVDIQGGFFCGDSKPFSGGGWEGNYDTGLPFNDTPWGATRSIEGTDAVDSPELFDTNCLDINASPSSKSDSNCQNVQYATASLASARALDVGDVIPFSLDAGGTNQDLILKRLNPNHKTGKPKDFGVASFFEDEPDGALGGLRLRDEYEENPPIVAAGVSPIANAMLDFRCWFTNSVRDSGGKCGKSNLADVYTTGFAELLLAQDSASFECRRPYFIVISDVEDTCFGNNEVADVAGMNSQTRFGGVEEQGVNTWVLDLGPSANAASPIANAGKGERIRVETRDELRRVLFEIIGLLAEKRSSFASAAVPSVQADVDDKIYITQFVPQNFSPVWEGHVYAFKKPLTYEVVTDPLSGGTIRRPVLSSALWDGGEVMKTQAPASGAVSLADLTTLPSISRSDFQVGIGEEERRIFFPMEAEYADYRGGYDNDGDGDATNDLDSLVVPRRKLPLGPVEDTAPFKLPAGVSLTEAFDDQFAALQLTPDTDPLIDLRKVLEVAKFTYEAKHVQQLGTCSETTTVTCETDSDCPRNREICNRPSVDYVLGDIFHATPLLVGGPNNGRYLSRQDFVGYKDFFQTQERRRKLLLVNSNDGQVHAFDAGQFGQLTEKFCSISTFRECTLDTDCPSGERCSVEKKVWKFNNGFGRELFAFIPREVMSKVKDFAADMLANPQVPTHRWTVDGTLVASDVYIDPVHSGLFSPDPPSDRSWRTVAIGGLRRGGSSYFALDISRPDPMIEFGEVTPPQGVRPNVPGADQADNPAIAEIPQCFGVAGNGGAGTTEEALRDCNPEYPSILWEFSDPDLGETWSTPDIGAVRTLDADGNPETHYVAIFGGGLDPKGFSSEDSVGDYLYMVDIETGRMIYKRFLDKSSAAAPPAAVDTDQDGFLDRIYIGTTGSVTPSGITDILESRSGKIYRVDLTEPVPLAFEAACTAPLRSTDACCENQDGCIVSAAWEPYTVFDTISVLSGAAGEDSVPIVPGTDKRIFFPPSVIFSTRLGRYAVAFATGNRENLWSLEPQGPNALPGEREDGNRVYLFVDDSDILDDPTTPEKDHVLMTEANLIDVTDPSAPERLVADPPIVGEDSDILNQPNGFRGWFIRMGQASLEAVDGGVTRLVDVRHEKAIGPVTAISGINIVSSFVPELTTSSAGGSDAPKCARRGFSRAYAQFTSDGRPIRVDSGTTSGDTTGTGGTGGTDTGTSSGECIGADCRSTKASDTLLSEPFIEQGGPCDGGEGMKEVLMEEIFPPNCSFASYHWNLSSMRADTGIECLAQIPVCITEKNWKDH